jgi:zinc protease
VIVGDIDTAEAMGKVRQHFGEIARRDVPPHPHAIEPEQTGERRLTIRKPGATSYWKAGYHAPSIGDPRFFPLLVLDAVLTGAKGLNLWTSFRTPPPQRSARLYRALVETGLGSSVSGALLPTAEPFLYSISVTVSDGASLPAVESAALAELERVRAEGITPAELSKAQTQLRARLIFENDSVTSIAHQLGYYETIATLELVDKLPSRIASVTLDQVNDVARDTLIESNRTIGWFQPS